jgi:hypothetical protein
MNNTSRRAISAEPRRVGAVIVALLSLGGCAFGAAPHLTNAAVEACERKADEQGYEGISERTSTPLAAGRYSVVLDVQVTNGYTQVTCSFDPESGATIEKPQKPAP